MNNNMHNALNNWLNMRAGLRAQAQGELWIFIVTSNDAGRISNKRFHQLRLFSSTNCSGSVTNARISHEKLLAFAPVSSNWRKIRDRQQRVNFRWPPLQPLGGALSRLDDGFDLITGGWLTYGAHSDRPLPARLGTGQK